MVGCQNCGGCCVSVPLHVRTPDDDWLRWARLFGVHATKRVDGVTKLTIFGPCHNYEPDSLTHCRDYENRPEMCRRFLCDAAKLGQEDDPQPERLGA
jgi:Fe-S-cluster containining protein